MYMEYILGCGIEYCKSKQYEIPAMLTSLPEMSELGMKEKEYIRQERWYV